MRYKTLEQILLALKNNPRGLYISEISRHANVTRHSVYDAIDVLLREGIIEGKFKKGRTYYKLVVPFKKIDIKRLVSISKKNSNNNKKKEEEPPTRLEFKNSISKLLEYFIKKYNIKDINIAFNYLLARGLLLEIPLYEINDLNISEILNDLSELKMSIKRNYFKKIAEERINKIKQDSTLKIHSLSKLLG